MIYINLLPVRDIKRRNKAKKEIILSAVSLFCYLSLLLSFAFYQAIDISRLQKTNEDLQTEKKQYNKILDEIKHLEEAKKILETRIEVIKQLKQSSSLTVHILDEVANYTPSNRMWLTGLSQTSADLKLAGMALDNQTIAKYMDDLGKSHYITNVYLANSSMKNFAERDLKSFSISCTAGFSKKTEENENKLR